MIRALGKGRVGWGGVGRVGSRVGFGGVGLCGVVLGRVG